jgi:hypothetical protein
MYRIPGSELDIDQVERMNADWRDLFSDISKGLKSGYRTVVEMAKATGRKTSEIIRGRNGASKVIMAFGALALTMTLQSCNGQANPQEIAPTWCEIIRVQGGDTAQGIVENFRETYHRSDIDAIVLGQDFNQLVRDENGYIQPGTEGALCYDMGNDRFVVMKPSEIPAETEVKDNIYG